MKCKWIGVGLCAILIAVLVVINASGRRELSKSSLDIGPNGTIAVPRNDNMTIVAEVPKAATNAMSGRR